MFFRAALVAAAIAIATVGWASLTRVGVTRWEESLLVTNRRV